MKAKLFLFIFIAICYNLSGQVTIGSDNIPNVGTLLDLKQHQPNLDNITSSKGLILPRVNLEKEDSLYPMFSENVSDYLARKTEIDAMHTGLMIYNLRDLRTTIEVPATACDPAKIVTDGTLSVGVAVWNGQKWKNLIENTQNDGGDLDTEVANNVFLLYDHEQNEYTYSKFGDAGYWMTTSLVTKTAPPSIQSSLNYSLWSNPLSVQQNASIANYGFPRKTIASITDDIDFLENKNVGLLYTKGAISGGKDITLPMQGICPDGWHIPTNIEYEALLTEIMNNLELYTVDGTSSTTRSQAITTSCSLFGPVSGAVSKPSYSGGFSFIMSAFASAYTGEIENNIVFEIACINDGKLGFFAGSFSANAPSYFNLKYSDWSNIQMLSIRCKKND